MNANGGMHPGGELLSHPVMPTDYIHAIVRDGNRIAASAESQLDSPVPSCPGWAVADLVWHVGIVHMFWRRVASGVLSGPDNFREPARPDNRALIDWFREGVEETANVLGGIDPSAPAWTWGRRKDVGFIQRRVAQETAVHCWDAVSALGGDDPVERALAADGVSEFVDEVLPGMSTDLGGPAQAIALCASDVEDDWLVRVGDGRCERLPAGAPVDATVRAIASELLLLLWSRRQPSQVQVDGDFSTLERFLARASF